MATCLGVNEQRDSLYVNYPSEPILAEAAVSVMADESAHKKILDHFYSNLVGGLIQSGPRGELVMRLVLLQLMDKERARKNSPYSTYITVKDFVEYLGSGIKEENKKSFKGNTFYQLLYYLLL